MVTYFMILAVLTVTWGTGVERRVQEMGTIFAGSAAECHQWAAEKAAESQRDWDKRIGSGASAGAAHVVDPRYRGGIRAAQVHSWLCAELGDAKAVRQKLPRDIWANSVQAGPGRPDGKLFYEAVDK
jgi:hypothetical protein